MFRQIRPNVGSEPVILVSAAPPPGRPTVSGAQRARQVEAAQIRLLYSNAQTGSAVTVVTAPILAYLQWDVVHHPVVVGWLLYMLLVSVGRSILARRYWRISPSDSEHHGWDAAFAIGAGMAGSGWGAAGMLLYPDNQLVSQVLLLFLMGGMMLGGAAVLAPRAESFLAFLLPAGLFPATRLLYEGDEHHVVMGVLAIVFTAATLTTTWHIYRAIASSLHLRFENYDLVAELQRAKGDTETLNQQLEIRVEERTAELHHAAECLRAEIVQREQMEKELLRVRKLESLGVLAGGIAHDFNNFLTVVMGNIDLARMQVDLAAPLRDILDQTESACDRAVLLSSQLLTFAKGGAPVRRVASVAKVVSDAVQLARAGAAVGITLTVDDDLWAAEMDSGQIGQVLHNILLNAKQAMPEGGTIEVRAENIAASADAKATPGGHVRISVRDQGPGISGEVLPLIFDPYFTTKGHGSGLGLATAYAIVAKHGGRLSAKSTTGGGAEFNIDLPASHSNQAPEPAPAVRARSGTGKLLVMDDEENIRILLARVLSRLGYEVQAAENGAEAIEMYEAARAAGCAFDVVLLDLTVSGGMGGVEAAARLKELDPSAKLIASSGYADTSVMSRFREYGFDEALPKPWVMAQLSEVFRRVLEQRE